MADESERSPKDPFRLPEAAGAAARMGRAGGQLFWTVETTAGRVQGIANGDIKQFKGVPYGASTAGSNRYMPPQKRAAWSGVRDCFGYGQVSPQVPMDLAYEYSMLINWDAHVGPGGMGEDCLNLNIWTPGVSDGAGRAVLVAFHGGGWTTGSGNAPMYDGAQLARAGNVVVVTVNHRLGALGYLALAEVGGPEFASGGVCGVLDMVAALEWVRDNIGRFGGDPDRVTIFGQSGGGSKVSTLMGAPAAVKLFHRAVAQSPPPVGAWTRDEGAGQAERLLLRLGLGNDRAVDIRKRSWQEILEAQAAVGDFRPVVDGQVLPEAPFASSAPAVSGAIPMIVGTTLHDRSNFFENFDVDDAGVVAVFRQTWGDRAEAILAAYRQESPDEPAFLIQGKAYTDLTRGVTLLQAHRKAALGAAPVYLYEWDWVSDAYDRRYGAFHAEDLDASFGLYRSPACGSGHAEGRLMVDRMVASLVAFAKTGDPNNALIPAWPAYDGQRRATLVFDNAMRVVDNHRGDMVRTVAEPTTAPPAPQ
ncbi:MAG: carboxylesterase family protein [Phenylobacterium sp.]|uniref:carboxylesterase/lipase family protein n=1 Tax=Phenylobacterium sp. TaxID=1871053 RepID=UPI002734E0E5|nr:carboxylesterase family protein [Phenylobacterium sp.]MDP3747668.1 carboxylesterase family protein [Phenylobacterium sp.]